MAFTYRLEKGSPLTEKELDDNFREVANIAQITADEINKKVTADTNEAKKQANEAAKQALKAKDEADRASQITGLDTVADAIGFAAVPFPDVWIPFNDSLRMLAGFGRDVKVGSDVVATYVNYERATTATYIDKSGVMRTAAINEPRFEKEGLLIEGQSTNLFQWSQQFIGKWIRVDGTGSPDTNFPDAIDLNNAAAGFVHTSVGNLTVGGSYTITAIVTGYVPGVTNIKGRFANSPQSSFKVTGTFRDYTVLSFTKLDATNSNHSVTGLSWEVGSVAGVKLCALQIEALPFASSYIPTNGAAVTRAADKCWIDTENNYVSAFDTRAIAVHFDTAIPSTVDRWPALLCLTSAYPKEQVIYSTKSQTAMMDFRTTSSASAGTPPVNCSGGGFVVTCNRQNESVTSVSGVISKNGRFATESAALPSRVYIGISHESQNLAIFGHIRNLRIWHHALSDAQIKGLK